MNFVLDTSLALAFVLADEANDSTDAVLDTLGRGARAYVPTLWCWEVVNVLLLAQRRGRLTEAKALQHAAHLRALPIETDEAAEDAAWQATRILAQKHRLSAYDAAYLEVALRRGLPLGSLDGELRAAAKAENVSVLPEKLPR